MESALFLAAVNSYSKPPLPRTSAVSIIVLVTFVKKRDVLEVVKMSVRDNHALNERVSISVSDLVIALDIADPERTVVAADIVYYVFYALDSD